MPRLGRAPTVEAFSKAFREGMEQALKDAAGRDGRLSKKEAQRLAEAGNVFADNALNYLERTKQKSVSVKKLLDRGEAYAYAMAEKVAGPNRRLSLIEARALPKDLRADFFKLRGKEFGGGEASGAVGLSDSTRQKLDQALGDRYVSSYDLLDAIEPQLKGISDPDARAGFAQAIAGYIEANPGSADRDTVTELTQYAYGAATGHLYAPDQRDAFADALVATDMGELQDLFGDWATQIAERAHDADERAAPLFGALREGCRMINEAAVAKSNGDMTMLGLFVDDASSMWGDESIMDGIARASLATHPTGSDWAAVAKESLETKLGQLWGESHGAVDVAGAVPVTDAALRDLAITIGQKGMAYGNTNDVPFRLMQIDDILGELGPRDDLRLVKATTLSGDQDDPDATMREAFMFLIYNHTSGQHVDFYVYENSLNP